MALDYDTADVSKILLPKLLRSARQRPDHDSPAGTHQVHWDGSLLPSGVYIYRLDTESFGCVSYGLVRALKQPSPALVLQADPPPEKQACRV